MESTWFQAITVGVKVIAIFVCFAVFAVMVKPQIATHVIPVILDYSETYAQSRKGVDLDPIFLSDGTYAGLPVTGLYATRHGYLGEGMYGELVTADTRVVAMNHFLVDYGSPMAKYAETFVAAADDAGLDWRLVASISGVESAFGRLIPLDSYNGWGWKGGPGGDFSKFDSWEHGIEHVTARIAVGYGRDIDVFVMEPTYCPPCGRNPQHAWANGVARYMEQLSEYRSNL
jgi:hypothetical protein